MCMSSSLPAIHGSEHVPFSSFAETHGAAAQSPVAVELVLPAVFLSLGQRFRFLLARKALPQCCRLASWPPWPLGLTSPERLEAEPSADGKRCAEIGPATQMIRKP